MVLLILLLTNTISITTSGLVTFIATREVYSESPEIRHPPHRAGALHGLGELQGHDSLQGQQHHNLGLGGRVGENAELEEEVDTERVGVHPRRSGLGHRGKMGGTNKCQDRNTCK